MCVLYLATHLHTDDDHRQKLHKYLEKNAGMGTRREHIRVKQKLNGKHLDLRQLHYMQRLGTDLQKLNAIKRSGAGPVVVVIEKDVEETTEHVEKY